MLMFSPSVIGHDDVKLGVLVSLGGDYHSERGEAGSESLWFLQIEAQPKDL